MRNVLLYGVLAIVLGSVLGLRWLLNEGNPQWHKYIYMYQAQVSGGRHMVLPVPPDYSGEWRRWSADGQLRCKITYEDGLRDGPTLYYRSDGSVRVKEFYEDGVPAGTWVTRNALDMGRKTEGLVRNGRPFQGSFVAHDRYSNDMVIIACEDGVIRSVVRQKVRRFLQKGSGALEELSESFEEKPGPRYMIGALMIHEKEDLTRQGLSEKLFDLYETIPIQADSE